MRNYFELGEAMTGEATKKKEKERKKESKENTS